MTFVPIKNLLSHALANSGISREVSAARIVAAAQEIIGDLGRAQAFEHGLLTVRVKSPIYAQELKLRGHAIRTALDEKAGVRIKGLKFLIRRVKV